MRRDFPFFHKEGTQTKSVFVINFLLRCWNINCLLCFHEDKPFVVLPLKILIRGLSFATPTVIWIMDTNV